MKEYKLNWRFGDFCGKIRFFPQNEPKTQKLWKIINEMKNGRILWENWTSGPESQNLCQIAHFPNEFR